MEVHCGYRIGRSTFWFARTDRKPGPDGEHRDATGVCHCLRGGVDTAGKEARSESSVPDAHGAAGSHTGHTGFLGLDAGVEWSDFAAPCRMAGDRGGYLLHLQGEAQPGEGRSRAVGAKRSKREAARTAMAINGIAPRVSIASSPRSAALPLG